MKKVLLLCTFVLIAVSSSAQMTITQGDLTAQVDVAIKSYQWDANDNASGSPQPDFSGLEAILNGGPADFSSMVASLKQLASFKLLAMPANVPGADSFATATHVQEVTVLDITTQQDSTAYLFASLSSNALDFLGYATALGFDINQDGKADTLVTRYSPDGWELRALPLQQGGAWQTEYREVSWLKVPILGLIRQETLHGRREYRVIGTTTLTTPAGSAQALVVQIFEFVDYPQANIRFAREQYSFIAKSGLSVEVAYDIDFDTRQRRHINDIAYFVPDNLPNPSAIEATAGELPATFELGQNYPNPFNPSTQIPFGLSEAGQVSLVVYNMLGQHVATLVDAWLPAGTYTSDFGATDLPSGVYLYQLRINGTLHSRAMSLLK